MCERLIEEVTIHHDSLCKLLAEENERYDITLCNLSMEISITEMKAYLQKLRRLQKDMANLNNQSKDLRKRTEYLRLWKQKKDENFAFEMERIKQMEQSLKPVKSSSSSKNSTE